MGLFETEDAKEFFANVSSLIASGVVDFVDSTGTWLKQVGDDWKVVDKETLSLRSILRDDE